MSENIGIVTNNVTKNATKNAQNILNKYFNEKDIVCFGEILEHDGYDKYGPQSNLWTLYIITKKKDEESLDNIYIIYRYYFEDWYEKREPQYENDSLYELEKEFNIQDIDHYDYGMLNKYKNEFSKDFDLDTLKNNTMIV